MDFLSEPINFSEALSEFGGDREGLVEVIGVFLETVQEQMQTLYRAIAAGEAEAVAMEAHRIKGGAATLIADDLAAAAYALELHGSSGSLAGVEPLLSEFEQELKRLCDYLQKMGIGHEGINR